MLRKEIENIVKTATENGMEESAVYAALSFGYMAHYVSPVERDCASPGIPCELCQRCGEVVPAT